jgi:hypothetical protein
MARPVTDRPHPAVPAPARIAFATAAAAVTAALANAVVRSIAVAVLDIPPPVLASSAAACAVGGAGYAVLSRFGRRAVRLFMPVTCVALALSMIPVVAVVLTDPPLYPGTSGAAGAVLALMHLVVAGALLGALRRAGAR